VVVFSDIGSSPADRPAPRQDAHLSQPSAATSSSILAFIADWYIPSSIASMIPLISSRSSQESVSRFYSCAPFMILAIGLLRVRHLIATLRMDIAVQDTAIKFGY